MASGRTSIMWSKKGICELDVHTPVPSRLTLTSTLVSFVCRLTSATRAASAPATYVRHRAGVLTHSPASSLPHTLSQYATARQASYLASRWQPHPQARSPARLACRGSACEAWRCAPLQQTAAHSARGTPGRRCLVQKRSGG